ncbi:MAG: hypothetical protein ACRC9K_12330 [Afipia sp.]
MNDQLATKPTHPTFSEQVLAVDVPVLAQRILDGGSRGAIQASTIEIVAMALQLNDMDAVVTATFNMMVSANRLYDEKDPTKREALRELVLIQIKAIEETLIRLGYDNPPTTNEEKTNG